ncbi:MAG: DUF2283 domain-containing protein [bacterium]
MDHHSIRDTETTWTSPLGPRAGVKYDPHGDILYLETCRPYPEQDSEMRDDWVVIRWNPKTRAVERIEILFLSRWTPAELERAMLPIDPTLLPMMEALRQHYAQAA